MPANAVPGASSKVAQAREVKRQIDALDHKVSLADEDFVAARTKHDKLVKQMVTAEKKIGVAQKRMGVLQSQLNTRVEVMYRKGQLGFLEVLLDTEDFEQFAAVWDVLKTLSRDEAAAVAELKRVRAEQQAAKRDLAVKERDSAKQVKIMGARKRTIERQLAERKRLLSGLEGEIAAIEAADRARALRSASSFTGARASRSEKRFPPPTRAPRTAVVAVAKRYLGAPYRWGASGPDSFDCSGFTMFVYRQVGVSLPHSSRAQFRSGQRVDRADLKPGDLVFFGSPIHHVGIYVGGGMYIHSPRTGDVVSIDPAFRSDYAGAVRP